MRLSKIIENEPAARTRRWGAALLLTSIGASVVGLMSPVATAKEKVIDAGSGQVDYIKQTPVQIPATCPGLKLDGVKTQEKVLNVNGRLVVQHTVSLGLVVLHHDVRRDGSIHNPRILGSSHPCFEANAKAAIIQWMTEPQEFELKDAAVKLPFVISGATVDELKLQLDDLLR